MLCGFREDFFSCFSYYKSLVDTDARGVGYLDPRGMAMVGSINNEFPKHCYTQNITALGLTVSEKKILLCYPL